ncbi:MAG: carboxymuconolactone decarboxylase family protein [Chloroflexi bacterium]|nr:carboxymuconolactone decarboxylase family protein [Chloroflexota bacterium]MCI0643870.1 carboxymuconolactone decarboxylase family protein [Chloroflexota bacterium]MCI0730595.1 carboxymuconolactone decarboxylase family protein [Chloroflexota bacterium]
MEQRLDYGKVLPEGMKAIYALDRYSHHSGLEPSLLELIKLRASQINGCAYCIDMHSKDARTGGESEQRLYNLSVWRETPYYTDRERAALAFTEAVTLIADSHVPDEVYEQARQQFSDEELVKLMVGIVIINTWNRLAITFGDVPGSYQPRHFVAERGRAEAAKVGV